VYSPSNKGGPLPPESRFINHQPGDVTSDEQSLESVRGEKGKGG